MSVKTTIMKKRVLLSMAAIFISLLSFSQISGVKSIPGDYASISAAISALNASGVGSGGVTFNIAAGYTETLTSLTAGLITTTTSTSSNPIVFQKSGSGANPIITGFGTAPGSTDYIIGIAGTDYITFNGIDVTEPTGVIEWGYAIMKASATDGAQYVTIKNCTITLNSTNTATKGIYANNHTASSVTALTITSTTGANSNLKIFNNTLNNCYTGIYVVGFADPNAPYIYYDQNNEIGKDGANTITNVAGAAATAGYGIYTQYQNNLKVANNLITSTMGGTGSPSGIYISTANNATVSVYSNTVSMQYSSTGAFNGIYVSTGGSGTTNTADFHNNRVINCNLSGMTSSTIDLMYLRADAPTVNYYNNVVKNNTLGSATSTATGTINYLYIYCSPTNLGTMQAYNDTVSGNTRIQSVVGGGQNSYLYISGNQSVANIYNNLVDNNIAASNGTTYGLYALISQATRNIYSNTVTNINNSAGTIYGLYLGNTYTDYAYLNKFQNYTTIGASSSVYGIYISSGGGPYPVVYCYNNTVSQLKTPSVSGTNNIEGIYIGSSFTTVGVYDNSVYLDGTTTGANFGTSALYTTTSSLLDLRGNILVNNCTPKGTGYSVALRFSSSSQANYSSLSNYNDLYAGTPGPSNLIYYDGTIIDQQLSTFQTLVAPRDGQSVTELPPFVNIASSPYDLHMKTTIATQCESGGTVISTTSWPIVPLSITTDMDGQPRFPNSGYPSGAFTPNAPDIGADEFGGIPNDLTAPLITFTPLTNTNNGSARVLTATFTDGSGVPTSGIGLPKLYWKINSGSWQSVTGVYISGNNYSFTFGAGTVLGDVVSYYIVAQDIAPVPNVTSNPLTGASGFSANPPACSTPPSTPATYSYIASISGIFHLGVGKDYPTLIAAVTDLNAKYMSGPVTFIFDDPFPPETFPITINSNPGNSVTNTLTIKPNTGATVVVSGNTPTGLVILNGIDYVTIDGSNTGGTDKSLTFQNTQGGATSYAIGITRNGGTDPSTNTTIKNCIIKAVSLVGTNTYGIYMNPAFGGYDNTVISNNTISTARYGILFGGTLLSKCNSCQIVGNFIGSANASDAITLVGIYLNNADNTLIAGNEIMGNPAGNVNPNQTGIYIGTGSTTTKVTQNKIHDFYHLNDDGWGVAGINYSSDASTITEISDNVIYNIKSGGFAQGVTSNNPYGILLYSGGNIKILHNNIYMSGSFLSVAYDGASCACIAIYKSTITNLDIRDNILKNSVQPLSTPSTDKVYAIQTVASDATGFTYIDYNDYYVDGINPAIGQENFIPLTTLANLQTFTGQDLNSKNIDPMFSSPTYLFPTTTLMPNAGIYLPNVPTDITGVNRTNPPDIGAYEFTTDPLITTTTASAVANITATLNGTANAKGTVFNLYFDYGLTNAYGSSVTATPSSVTGNTLNTMSVGLTGLTGFTTYHYRARGVTSGGLIVYGNDMTFVTLPNPPTVVTTAATAITSSGATLNGTVNANGGTATVTFDYGLTTSYGTNVNGTPNTVTGVSVNPVAAVITGLLPNTTYHYRINATNISGTTNGNDMTFTTVAIPAIVVTNFANGVGSTSATLNGTVTANNASTNVTFQYGLTTAYGSVISATPATVNGMNATAVMANLSGLTINTTYHFRCVGVNMAGTTNGADQQFTTNCVAPVITISGPSSACAGFGGYVYTTQSGNSSYNWSLSAGGTITSGAGTNSITVTWNTVGAQTVSVNYNNQYGCSDPSPVVYNVTVNATPTPTITGSANACVSYTNNTYSTQTGMNNYTWSVSAGGTITAGQGTNAITVTWNSTGAQTVSVNYTNASSCSALSPTIFNVTVNALPSPTITGQTTSCINSGYITYTTEAGMTNYVWTVSSGGVINFGSGTYQISVTWTVGGAQSVSVNYNNPNGCAALTPTVLNVTVNTVPDAAGTITGTSVVCGGAQGIAYSCAAINGAVSYVWTLPAGATIATGGGTNSITVDFATNASSGNITVYGNNVCGNGTPSPNFPVTVNALPDAAGNITGANEVCQGTDGVVYTVPSITGATSYTWTVPTGATIVSGANTNSITVDFSMSAASGNVTVYGSNSCGNGTASSLQVTVNPIPVTPVVTFNGNILYSSATTGNQWYYEGNMIPGATGQTYQATQSGWYWTVVDLNGCSSDTSNHAHVIITSVQELHDETVNIYPVPNNGRFTVSISSSSTDPFSIIVFTSLGTKIHEVNDIHVTNQFNQVIELNPAINGIYTVVIRNNSYQSVRKIVVSR